ncbi:MAG: patatin-like phospholipase family protein [Thermodesulfovibrionales bacterium]|nr:patatin-like phospholipase family protein [Thermodesulfovibrionales bacterium]
MRIINKFSSILLFIILFPLLSCAPKEAIKHQPPTPKIALVLGAGASKGFAHIGVLKVLESNQIPINMIVGTSAGSFVGSLYAYGYNAFQLQKMALSIEKKDLIDLTIPDNGFIKGELLENYINSMIMNIPFEKLKIPFYAVATNIENGKEIIFGSGNVGMAVRASCAVPGIFRPVTISGKTYIDGGVISPVPVSAAKRMGANIVIAVDISGQISNPKPENTIETILNAINIMYAEISEKQIKDADIVIKPKVESISSTDFSKRHEAILEGEKAALEALPKIKALFQSLNINKI